MNTIYVDGTAVGWFEDFIALREECRYRGDLKISCWFLDDSILRVRNPKVMVTAFNLGFIAGRHGYCDVCVKYLPKSIMVEGFTHGGGSLRRSIFIRPVKSLEVGLRALANIDPIFEDTYDAVRLGLM